MFEMVVEFIGVILAVDEDEFFETLAILNEILGKLGASGNKLRLNVGEGGAGLIVFNETEIERSEIIVENYLVGRAEEDAGVAVSLLESFEALADRGAALRNGTSLSRR